MTTSNTMTAQELKRLSQLRLIANAAELEVAKQLSTEAAALLPAIPSKLPGCYIPIEFDKNKPLDIPYTAMYGIARDLSTAAEVTHNYSYVATLTQYSPCVRVSKDSNCESLHRRVNLYGILLGGTGAGKGASLARARRLLFNSEDEASTMCSRGIPKSGEGLAKRYEAEVTIGEPPHRCHVIDEFGVVIKRAEGEGSSLWETLNYLFDYDDPEGFVTKGTITGFVRFSMVGGATIDTIDDFDSLFGEDINGGFKRRNIYTWSEVVDVDDTWTRDLIDAPAPPGSKPRVVTVTPELLRWTRWWKNYWWNILTLEQRKSFTGLTQILTRVAIVSAALNEETVVSWDCFLAAAAFCDYQLAMRFVLKPSFAKNTAGKICEAILKYVRIAAQKHADADGFVKWRDVKRAGGKRLTEYGSELERQREFLIREDTLYSPEPSETRRGAAPVRVKLVEHES